MKKYSEIISRYDEDKIITHAWSQTAESVFNAVVSIWNSSPGDTKIAIITRKKLGLKKLVKYLKSKQLDVSIAGKGADGLRVIEIYKDSEEQLKLDQASNEITFSFAGKSFKADTARALFSPTNLDVGTNHLLEYVIGLHLELSSSHILDLGAGWGAIGNVLQSHYPSASFTCIESDSESLNAAKKNLPSKNNVFIKANMLTDTFSKEFKRSAEFEYVVCNPPFHITTNERDKLFKLAASSLKPNGQMIFVVEQHFANRFKESALKYLRLVEKAERANFMIYRFEKP